MVFRGTARTQQLFGRFERFLSRSVIGEGSVLTWGPPARRGNIVALAEAGAAPGAAAARPVPASRTDPACHLTGHHYYSYDYIATPVSKRLPKINFDVFVFW
ncbi:jg13888 [Pararge aegeria aegeria]|uniref:Jg13888 protein n=1 Tax=Pararge aegeria aegeria TaxID=348720 RepID=A0A8S4SAX5_9NEOP|nr:jg13888 [Pararge aegeria aegeria]